MTGSPLTYLGLRIEEERLHQARMDLYHSTGPGYHVFEGFLSPDFVGHMARVWASAPTGVGASPPGGRTDDVPAGYPNFSWGTAEHRTWENFFWNPPFDEVTYDVAAQVQRLRNRVESRKPYFEVLPFTGRAVAFTVTLTTAGSVVAPHRDWVGQESDPVRTQATLLLSTRGEDYRKGGFFVESNQGQPVDLADVAGRGDLVLWRYNNLHWVDEVSSDPGDLGFCRVLFPSPRVVRRLGPVAGTTERALGAARQWAVGNQRARQVLRPLYRTYRGWRAR